MGAKGSKSIETQVLEAQAQFKEPAAGYTILESAIFQSDKTMSPGIPHFEVHDVSPNGNYKYSQEIKQVRFAKTDGGILIFFYTSNDKNAGFVDMLLMWDESTSVIIHDDDTEENPWGTIEISWYKNKTHLEKPVNPQEEEKTEKPQEVKLDDKKAKEIDTSHYFSMQYSLKIIPRVPKSDDENKIILEDTDAGKLARQQWKEQLSARWGFLMDRVQAWKNSGDAGMDVANLQTIVKPEPKVAVKGTKLRTIERLAKRGIAQNIMRIPAPKKEQRRRLAANDSMDNVFTMLWILPLLVIFVFWFKRYIVTRKNNDDNEIVQDNANEDENSLNNIV